MERGCTDNSIEATAERKSKEIGSHECNSIAKVRMKIRPSLLHHVPGKVEANDATAREFLEKNARYLSSATARIEHALVAAQGKLAKNTLSPPKLRLGEAIIVGCVPLAGVRLGKHKVGSDRGQRLIEVGEDIFDVLDAN